MDVSFIPGIKCVLIGDHEVGKVRTVPDQAPLLVASYIALTFPSNTQTSLISAYGTREPLNPFLPGLTEPIQIHVEHLYKLYLLSIHDTEGVHPPPNAPSTSDSDSPPASLGLPISSSQRSVQVVRGSDSIVTARKIEYGLANVILICFSLADRWSFEHVREVWHKEIHQLFPHIPFILVGTKLDLRRPDPTTPQPQVRAHPFSRFTFCRPTVARSNSSHSFGEKIKKNVKASNPIDQRPGANQIESLRNSNTERPFSTKHTSWYGINRASRTSHNQLRHTPLVIDVSPANLPSTPRASGSSITSSPQATHLAPPKPSSSKRQSLNVSGVGRSLSTINPFKRTRAGSIPTAALCPDSPVKHSEEPTGLPSLPRRGSSGLRPVLFHRHTADIVTASTTSGSGSSKNIAFSGTPVTHAADGEVTAPERVQFNRSRTRVPHPIPLTMSPITLDSLIGGPITGPTPSEPHSSGADPTSPLSSSKGKAKVTCIETPSASTTTKDSYTPGSPEASPHQGGRTWIPRASERNSPVSYSEANALAHEIGASAYIECSALTLVNVVAVFEEAVKIAVERRTASSSTLHRSRRASFSISSQKDCVVG